MTEQKRVLVKEKLDPEGVKYLEDLGFQVDIGTEWDADELLKRIPEYHGLIIRSATKVNRRRDPGRREPAGRRPCRRRRRQRRRQGGDEARRHRGERAAEQRAQRRRADVALLMACARNLAQAHAVYERRVDQGPLGQERRRGARQDAGHHRSRPHRVLRRRGRPRPRHERARLRSVRAGREVPRARPRACRQPARSREADFITVHLPKNAETLGFVGDDEFAEDEGRRARHQRARGGIIDEDAWARAIESGKVRRRPSTCTPRSRRPRARCSSTTAWSPRRTSARARRRRRYRAA